MPFLAWMALLSLAESQGDLASRAELRLLGLLGAACLAAIGALCRRRAIVELTAAALVAVCWCLAESTLRGSVVTGLLLGAVALAAALGRRESEPALYFTALAVAWQLLTRPDLLLVPLLDARTLVSVAVLPLLCGLALARFATAHGERAAWIAGLAAGVVAPGFNVTVTMTLVAVAAGTFLARAPGDAASPDAAIPDAAMLRRAALLVVLGASLVAWPLSPLVLAAAFAGRLTTWRRVAAGAVFLALFAAVSGALGKTPPNFGVDFARGLDIAALSLLVLPFGVLGGFLRAGSSVAGRCRWMLGLLVILAGASVGGDPEALAPGLLVLFPCLDAGRSRRQLEMSLALAAGVGLAVGYPWLHADPLLLIERPILIGLAALAFAAAWSALDFLRLLPATRTSSKPGPVVPIALVLAFLFPSTPPLAVFEAPKVLAAASPESLWELATPVTARKVIVDSNMVHGAHLEAGRAVASIELLDGNGRVVASAPLLAGEHTADWAAGRPDIAATGLVVPEPRSRRPSPDRSFFEQRYRATLTTEGAVLPEAAVAAVRLRRAPDLPELTRLVVRRLELRP